MIEKMATRVQDLSEAQRKAYQKFTELVSDCIQPHHNDEYLFKWFKVKKFDSKKAADMFRDSMKWREKNGVDHILEMWEPLKHLEQLTTHGHVGYSKIGYPVWLIPPGRLDVKALFSSVPLEDILLTSIHRFESMRKVEQEQSQRLGRDVSKRIMIIDLEGMDYSLAMNPILWKLAVRHSHIISTNYPDSLESVIFVNCPSFITLPYRAIRPLVSEWIISKVHLYGTDRSVWVPALLEKIDADQLPKHWGGTCVDADGDPRCPSKVCVGFDLPKSIYLKDPQILAQKGLKSITVDICSKSQLNVEVTRNNSVLKWIFYSDGADITFTIHRSHSKGLIEVVSYPRIKCYFKLVEGEIELLESGQYVVTFDNSYYKLKAKTISYSVVVMPSVKQ